MSEVIGKTFSRICREFEEKNQLRAFAVGFAVGQIEKVYIGACPACMFRPSKDHFQWYLNDVLALCKEYKLTVTILESQCEDTPREIWVSKSPEKIGAWLDQPVNSPTWHVFRARACGIPDDEIDTDYHKRDGYGEKCES